MTTAPFRGFNNALIIDERIDIRSTARDAIKELGVAQTASASSAQEAWTMLESMPDVPDWIVTCISPEAPLNAFHLLALVVNEPSLINTRVSFITSPTQTQYLAPAFELGLLSFHMTPFTKGSLVIQFKKLLEGMSEKRHEHCLTAAEYLRDHLVDAEKFQNLIHLEESLARRFSDQPALFLKLAEAQMLNGQSAQAKLTLQQAKHLGADLSTGVKQLRDMISAENPDQGNTEETSFVEAFNLQSAMIVDSDETTVNQISSLLNELGIKEIITFNDGQSAALWVDDHDLPPIVIHEWKLPKLSGAALLQRMVQKGARATTLVIMSSLLQPEDHALLKEMGASMVTKKPIVNEIFLRSLMSALREDRFPNSAASLERRVRHQIVAGDVGGAEVQLARLKGIAGVQRGTLLAIEAEIAYLKKDYELTKQLVQDAILEGASSGPALSLLGKAYLKLGDKDAAFKCLNRSQQFSSANLERLCLIAEVGADLGNQDEAEKALEKAQSIDKDNDTVKATNASIALSKGDASRARDVMNTLDSLSNVISNMNNRAVTLSLSGKIAESIELYKTALAAVPETKVAETNALKYNLGLAHIKIDQLAEALKVLETISASGDSPIQKKSASLSARVKAAKAAGTKLELAKKEKAVSAKIRPTSSRPIALHAMPGEICLHLLYSAGELFLPEIGEWMAKTPQYRPQNH